MIACVDNPPDWRLLLSRDAVRSVVEAIAGDSDRFHAFEARFRAGEGSVEPVVQIKSEIAAIQHQVQHLKAFHGCAIRNECDYTERGILRSDIERLTNEAYKIFGDRSKVDKCVAEIGDAYRVHNHGKVFFTYSRRFALSSASTHTEGSEYLRAIAWRLGPGARRHYETYRGSRALVEVQLPTDWAKSSEVRTALELSFLQWCASISTASLSASSLCGGFPVTRDIPPDLITNVYYPR